MSFRDLPPSAAWQHVDARRGFEVVFFRSGGRVEGSTAAVEGSDVWVVEYAITVGPGWSARSAQVRGRSAAGAHAVELEHDGSGHWTVNGRPAPELDGCRDVDLESSALTNAFPVHRLGLAVGEQAEAPAAYVRALDLGVERLEQQYRRLADAAGRPRYRYRAPRFGFEAELVYDEFGLVVAYPGLATRAA